MFFLHIKRPADPAGLDEYDLDEYDLNDPRHKTVQHLLR